MKILLRGFIALRTISRCHKKGNLMKFFIFLSVSSFTLLTFMAQGRVIHNHIDLSQVRESEVLMTRKMIGSRPPRCERKCRNCGHCKAVQVPVSPLVKRSHKLYAVNSRGDDLSNYKPMCWKCQCGNSFFNP
ncbi:Epidermal patterning factor-like protein [Heracleum sosnowskyi]|uniref:Epidermal patterning factor-like protein n=1 Tax=Heracleum sosnowskyi TaxID=360622 RepID=A0AAD8N1D0_9APIA|nr:Epidermal patterning factor-like protein [Heracleum sosnowskyi]